MRFSKITILFLLSLFIKIHLLCAQNPDFDQTVKVISKILSPKRVSENQINLFNNALKNYPDKSKKNPYFLTVNYYLYCELVSKQYKIYVDQPQEYRKVKDSLQKIESLFLNLKESKSTKKLMPWFILSKSRLKSSIELNHLAAVSLADNAYWLFLAQNDSIGATYSCLRKIINENQLNRHYNLLFSIRNALRVAPNGFPTDIMYYFKFNELKYSIYLKVTDSVLIKYEKLKEEFPNKDDLQLSFRIAEFYFKDKQFQKSDRVFKIAQEKVNKYEKQQQLVYFPTFYFHCFKTLGLTNKYYFKALQYLEQVNTRLPTISKKSLDYYWHSIEKEKVYVSLGLLELGFNNHIKSKEFIDKINEELLRKEDPPWYLEFLKLKLLYYQKENNNKELASAYSRHTYYQDSLKNAQFMEFVEFRNENFHREKELFELNSKQKIALKEEKAKSTFIRNIVIMITSSLLILLGFSIYIFTQRNKIKNYILKMNLPTKK